jgi:hypothetical protein
MRFASVDRPTGPDPETAQRCGRNAHYLPPGQTEAPFGTNIVGTAASGLEEGQKVRIDDVCVSGGHPVRQVLVDLQRAVLQQLGRQRS